MARLIWGRAKFPVTGSFDCSSLRSLTVQVKFLIWHNYYWRKQLIWHIQLYILLEEAALILHSYTSGMKNTFSKDTDIKCVLVLQDKLGGIGVEMGGAELWLPEPPGEDLAGCIWCPCTRVS